MNEPHDAYDLIRSVQSDTDADGQSSAAISEQPALKYSAWRGFWLVMLGHVITLLLLFGITQKEYWVSEIFSLPLIQIIYVVPMIMSFNSKKEKRAVKGVLIGMCVTLIPMALAMLLALAGLGLCFVIMAGSVINHH